MSEQNNLEANKQLVQRWFDEVWNKGRADAIAEMLAEDAIVNGLSEDAAQPLRGPAGFVPFHSQFREAFPNIEVVIEDTIAEGDKVAVRFSVRGKHEGDSLGFKSTGSTAEFDGTAIVRVKDGKIVEAWNNVDFMKMYRQLGAL
ncbi:MAG TPA: ester cyclase [Pyrinomonadaceae bacterium]|nr:ester cyclase [Pyrinomonadaceae bacterium]